MNYYVSGQSVNGGLGKGKKFYFLSPSIGPSFVPQHFISPTFSGWESMGAVWVIKQISAALERGSPGLEGRNGITRHEVSAAQFAPETLVLQGPGLEWKVWPRTSLETMRLRRLTWYRRRV